jgi:hypothetical protein
MAIEIARVGSSHFQVAVTPPHGTWVSDRPLTATDVLEQLSRIGVHSTDATDALDESGADWRPAHDEEVRRRRSEGATGSP